MIRSMTGYGQAIRHFNSKTIHVELRSLNSKQLDFNLRLPSVYRSKESELRTQLSPLLERGKIELTITTNILDGERKAAIDLHAVQNYYAALLPIAQTHGSEAYLLNAILQLPNTIQTPEETVETAEWNTVQEAIEEAINDFEQFRLQEGNILATDFQHRIALVRMHLTQVEEKEPQRLKSIKDRLQRLMEEHLDPSTIDHNRFEQELLFHIDKLDITEEKVRLVKHLDYFEETLSTATSQGKKLGFITQEIGREINTIGSKANDADIQTRVVCMKEELEKIREQLMNIL